MAGGTWLLLFWPGLLLLSAAAAAARFAAGGPRLAIFFQQLLQQTKYTFNKNLPGAVAIHLIKIHISLLSHILYHRA